LAIGTSTGVGWSNYYESGEWHDKEFELSVGSHGNNTMSSPYLNILPNKPFVLSFESKFDKTNNVNENKVFLIPSNYATYGLLSYVLTNTVNWTRHVFKGTTLQGWDNIPIRMRFNNNGTTDGSDVKLMVRNIKLEYGNMPTDWTPAPEDAVSTILNQRDGAAMKIWSGTAAQLPANRDSNTIYFVE
jgi:hypothetical protein